MTTWSRRTSRLLADVFAAAMAAMVVGCGAPVPRSAPVEGGVGPSETGVASSSPAVDACPAQHSPAQSWPEDRDEVSLLVEGTVDSATLCVYPSSLEPELPRQLTDEFVMVSGADALAASINRLPGPVATSGGGVVDACLAAAAPAYLIVFSRTDLSIVVVEYNPVCGMVRSGSVYRHSRGNDILERFGAR
jgi:hypothetical protein